MALLLEELGRREDDIFRRRKEGAAWPAAPLSSRTHRHPQSDVSCTVWRLQRRSAATASAAAGAGATGRRAPSLGAGPPRPPSRSWTWPTSRSRLPRRRRSRRRIRRAAPHRPHPCRRPPPPHLPRLPPLQALMRKGDPLIPPMCQGHLATLTVPAVERCGTQECKPCGGRGTEGDARWRC